MNTLYDTLEYDGDEKSFDDWGFALQSVDDQVQNSANDTFTATIAGASIAAEGDSPTFPFEAEIIVRTNRSSSSGDVNTFSAGSITFQGKRVENPARATGSEQGVTYKFHGPWYDLLNTHYQQTFKGSSGTPYLNAELVMNTSTAVPSGMIYISVGDQIQAILQWLLDQYSAQGFAAPFQYVARDLNAGAIDLSVGSTTGSPGGNYSAKGFLYNYAINVDSTVDESLFYLFLPDYIAKPMMCADALRKVLEMSPRVNISFDYSQSPPIFYASLVDNMEAANLALLDNASNRDVDIQGRDDLVVRCVNIIYRITSTVDGVQEIDYAQDKWGPNGSNSSLDPNGGLRVVSEMVDLSGYNQTSAKAHLDVEPVQATADSGGTDQALKRTWWASKRGGEMAKMEDSRLRFQDKTFSATTIPDATIINSATGDVLGAAALISAGLCDIDGNLVLNRLVRGTAHAWMAREDGQPVVSMKVKLIAAMTYAEYDATSTSGTPDTDTTGNRVRQANSEEHHVNIEVTNGVTGEYTTTASETPGETYTVGEGGIAQYLYNHMIVKQFEGQHVKVEAAFGAGVTLRNKINFTGGAALWTTMNAQCQAISRHYGRKQTTVKIGVAKHLNSGQLSALLNAWRFRRPWYNPLLRSDNTLGSGGEVDLAITSGNANGIPGLANDTAAQVYDYETSPTGSTPGVINSVINTDATKITAALAATTPTPVAPFVSTDIKTMQPRECNFCDESGDTVYAVVHTTGFYTKS